jgi:hypothetical protein
VDTMTRSDIRAEAARLRTEGLSFAAIAARFTEAGVPTARGGRWHPPSVRALILTEPSDVTTTSPEPEPDDEPDHGPADDVVAVVVPTGERVPLPDNLSYLSEVRLDHGTFTMGESVWVQGWAKSKGATYRIHRVLSRPGVPIDVQVSYDHRGTRQIHSVSPSRIRRRRDKRDRV